MDFSSYNYFLLLQFLVIVSLFCSNNSLETRNQLVNQTFRSDEGFYKLKKTIAIRLKQITKPAVKTIQSSDGDIIDCVLIHQQPAFDHPLLKGQKPLDPPKIPRGDNHMSNFSEYFQLWSLSDESCPDGTIPIRRITEQDILRASPNSIFERKNSINYNHQYAFQAVKDGEFHGGQATLNVWTPYVEGANAFSLAQLWVMSGTFYKDLNTIEAGWQVHQHLYGDNLTRLFIYWTPDAYQTGCYNLKCPGFVQISQKIALGAAIAPTSTYSGNQFEITLSIWKDVKTGNWWLRYGSENIGYWPSSLFTHLKDVASMVHWGGEIVNEHYPQASSTQMGSGHFPEEGYKKASYFKNMYVVDSTFHWIPPTNLINFADSPNCYNIKGGVDSNWGTHFYYGGPGKNNNCL